MVEVVRKNNIDSMPEESIFKDYGKIEAMRTEKNCSKYMYLAEIISQKSSINRGIDYMSITGGM